MNYIKVKFKYKTPNDNIYKISNFNIIDFFHITVLLFQIYIYLYAISSVRQYISFCDNLLSKIKNYKLKNLTFMSDYLWKVNSKNLRGFINYSELESKLLVLK